MADVVTNRRDPEDIDDEDVAAAFARIEARDPGRAQDANHIVQTITWGEGMGLVSQSSVQNWLWYQLPTKYMTDEVGYMGRLAGVAAELFDELGLDRYAAICRSETTREVHAAFDRSTTAGFEAFRRARAASGIDPPDTDTLVWGEMMGPEEAAARSTAESALEAAIAAGTLIVGGRAWRKHQRALTDATLDADHPTQPGQSWRTVMLTERIARWIAAGERRSPILGSLRARVANDLLVPIDLPADTEERLAPLVWLLDAFGEKQKLTQAGYLNTAFVRRVIATCPWQERSRARGAPRTEADAKVLLPLRELAVRIGALRKRRGVLERTSAGAAMVTDPTRIWDAFVRRGVPQGWDGFAFSTTGLVLLETDLPVSPRLVHRRVAEAAAEMGWQSDDGYGNVAAPSATNVHFSTFDTVELFGLFGLLDEQGDWQHRTWQLTPAGRTAMLAMLSVDATGPRDRP